MTFSRTNINFLFLALFSLSLFSSPSYSQSTVLSETFESSSSIPASWSQINVSGTSVWSIKNGGTNDLGSNHPSSAHGGTRNAFISSQSTSGNVRKLVTPELDLSGLGNISLEFWEARLIWGVDTDQLKVYYRTSSSGSWVLLTTYSTATTGWVKRTISLPNPSATYYVAFEGIPQYGYGICVDDVIITASIANDVSMTSIEVKDKEFVKAQFKNLGVNNLTSCKFNFTVDNGTTVYTQSWGGNLATNSTGTVQIDTFYFSHGLHNIKCWSSNPNSSGDGDRSNDTIYADYYIVRQFPYTESFENTNLGYWKQPTDDNMNWTRLSGLTTSTGTGPTTARNGSFYMYTEASSNYNKTANLVSPDMDISILTNPYLEVWYHMYGGNIGSLNFDIDSVSNWITGIDTSINGNQGNSWHKKLIRLKDYSNLNKVRLRAITGNGFLSDIAIDDIKVLDIPYVDLGSDTTICSGNQISFSVDTGITYSYVWKAAGYTDTLSTNNSITVDSSGSYIVIVSAAYGYSAIDTIILTVAPLPIAYFGINASGQCLNENFFNFYDSSSISSGTFSCFWSFGDNDTSTQQNPNHEYQAFGNYTVSLLLTSNYYCRDSISQNVIVNPSPLAQFGINDTDQCFRDNYFQFTDNSTVSTGTISGYFWSFGDTNTSMTKNPGHQFSSVDTFTTTLIITTDQLCRDTTSKQVYLQPMPEAKFSISDSTQCLIGNNFIFTNKSGISQGTLIHNWAFGDNKNSIFKDPTHSYTSPGSYQINLISISQNGCSDTAFSSLIVYAMPEATILIGSIDTQCFNNHQFNLADNSTYTDGYGANRSWDLGDGNSDTALNIIFNYLNPGYYDLTLIVQSNYGCQDTASISLTLHPSPKSAFSVNSNAQCQDGNLFSFTNISSISSGSLNHFWDFGDGNNSINAHPTNSYTNPGTYTIWLKSTSNNLCTDSTKMAVVVHPEPIANFSVNEEGQCLDGNNFKFTNHTTLSSGTFNSEWHLGDGTIINDTNATRSYNTIDSFHVDLHVTSDKNCKDSFTKLVYIKPLPIVGFTINDIEQCLTNNQFIFTDTSSAITGKLIPYWHFGDGIISTDSNPDHHYQNSGIYTVKLIISNDQACRDSISQTITVHALPKVDLGNDTALVDTISFILDAGPDFVNYFWQDSSSQQTFELITSSMTIGSHLFSVTVDDTNTCSNSDTIKITIFEHISIRENSIDLQVKVYPNPAHEYLYIENNKPITGKLEMAIYSIDGKKMWSKHYHVGSGIFKEEIDLSGYVKGSYLLLINQNENHQSFKILIY